MTINKKDLADAVGLVKEANDLIAQLQSENADLRKQVKLASESNASDTAVKALLDKMASIVYNGRPILEPSQRERFAQGFKKQCNVVSVFSDVLDRFAQVTKEAAVAGDSHSVGEASVTKVADEGDHSPLARIARGRISM